MMLHSLRQVTLESNDNRGTKNMLAAAVGLQTALKQSASPSRLLNRK